MGSELRFKGRLGLPGVLAAFEGGVLLGAVVLLSGCGVLTALKVVGAVVLLLGCGVLTALGMVGAVALLSGAAGLALTGGGLGGTRSL